jgi:hypothetical protein
MLTPKKQAEELVRDFGNIGLALLCVRYILRSTGITHVYDYWIEIREELLKLKENNDIR